MHNKSLEEKLRLHAYHLWEADGRPEGRSTEYWEKARALLGQEAAAAAPVVPVTSPDEAADASAIIKQSAKKPVKAKSKVTPPGEESVKTSKTKAKPKDDSKVARKAAAKTAAKPKAADTAPKKPKAAAKTAKPKATAEAAEKPGKKPAVEKAPAKPASKAAPKVSKTPKK
ncbi:DUF2934 domain-containing protein [Caballeronia sp. SEWSISQ10-4 2]|uniref:DUF2934 domain-containing protein n=1 Tax=Caballeronia sp. SEWSISQ10-4 2 TaxID=2937438 RepID=UPI0026507640|nr:DUF2934 domain-containing protein [Caballeronia sp. SEWSISQ10-4 2]MDN7178315.1 DUF2934 domain-containing protein [Caballeronia sp. SEWSISQ10-4 2]